MSETIEGRLIVIKNGYSNGNPMSLLEKAEFGMVTDEGQEKLFIGSNTGNIQVVTERNIAQLAVPDGSIGRTELDGEVNTLLDSIGSVDDIAEVTTTTKGLMTPNDKVKLNGIEDGANKTVVNNTLTSLSTTEALSAYQGKLLKDEIDTIAGGGTTVIDNLNSTDTSNALSANQGRILKGLVDGKASTATATQSSNGLMSATDKQKLDNINTTPINVVNSLTSTSTSDALSAYQGKVLNDTKLSGYQFGTSRKNTSNVGGHYSHATGEYAYAEGYSCLASGDHSNALGRRAQALNYASTAIGLNSSMTQISTTSYNATADAFVIGNGVSDTSPSNAFRITFDGKVFGRSAFNSSGADYAEYFEWVDGNVNNEDRVGYFVTLDEDKIRKANSSDDYILGIISATASVIGNSASEGWNEQYIKDEFGRMQYHYVDVEYEELDENGNKIVEIKNEYHPIYNPNYDPSLKYIPREDRVEWSPVGMLGVLLVRDDGSCQVNGYCKSNNDGIATKSDDGYRVMKRVSDNIIQVLVK